MARQLNIRCKDLGVDHDSFVSGTSLSDLIDCVEQRLKEEGIAAETPQAATLIRDTARSALLQASRPASRRSVRLSTLIASLTTTQPPVRSASWKATA